MHLSLAGGVGIPEKEVTRPPTADWLSPKAWGEICRIANVSASFATLPDDIAGHLEEWKAVFDSVREGDRGGLREQRNATMQRCALYPYRICDLPNRFLLIHLPLHMLTSRKQS